MKMIRKIHKQKPKTRKLTLWGHKVKLKKVTTQTVTLTAQDLHIGAHINKDSLRIIHQIVIDHDQIKEPPQTHIQKHSQIQIQIHNKHNKLSLDALDADAQIVLKSNPIAETSRRC